MCGEKMMDTMLLSAFEVIVTTPNPRVQTNVVCFGNEFLTLCGGTRVDVEGNINSGSYVLILEQNLCPVIAKDFSARPCIFEDDNFLVYNSRFTMQWKSRTESHVHNTCIMWPLQGPDISIVENVWPTLKVS